MVTKPSTYDIGIPDSLILAKNHMVTKHDTRITIGKRRLILAKNHMVTKQNRVIN